MKVIISSNCLSLVGTLENGCGYHLQHRKNGAFAKRNSNGHVPSDGHLRFIFLCAEMARNELYIDDIQVSGYELKAALTEVGLLVSANRVDIDYEYNAAEVLDLKTTFGL
jgi:hypothetical protein